jgi:hypothetical protein
MEFLQYIFSSIWIFFGFSLLLLLTFGFITSVVKFIRHPTENKSRKKPDKLSEDTLPTNTSELSKIVIGSEGIFSSGQEDILKATKVLQSCSGFAMVTSHRKDDGSFSLEVLFSDLLESKTLYEIGLAHINQCIYNADSEEEQ